MKRFSSRHQMSTLSELNVTPLLDLAFVLLIIFMITTPLMEGSNKLVLPTHKAVEGAAGPDKTETISIDREALITLENNPTPVASLDQLETLLVAMRVAQPGLVVNIRAHKELSVQQLVDVMNTVKRAGITKVGMAGTTEGH